MNKQDKKQAVQPSDLGLDVAQLTSATASPFSLPFLWHVYAHAVEAVLASLPEEQRKVVEGLLVMASCISKAENGTLSGMEAQMLKEAVVEASFVGRW